MAAGGGTKALLLAHSMGNLVSLAFLRMHTPAWRAQHIAALVALSGPWGGSVTALKGARLDLNPRLDVFEGGIGQSLGSKFLRG